MPSCEDGREHCNNGIQVRANVALTAAASSDDLFTPIEIGPKSQRGLDVVFRPDALGHAEATISIESNDPDMPELSFRVTADGANETAARPKGESGDPDTGDAAGTADEGCGCRTAGQRSSTPPQLALGGLVFAVALLARRRLSSRR